VWCTPAFAKDVFIEWKPIQGALQYELEIQRAGKVVGHETLTENKWSGELPSGAYAYRLRAHDKLKRAGTWSEMKALAVMPESPKPLSPREGDTVYQFKKNGPFKLKWKAVDVRAQYKVEVKRGEQVLFSKVVDGSSVSVPDLPAGEYSWQVSAFVAADGRGPANLAGRSWQSEIRTVDRFELEVMNLAAPKLISPLGTIAPPRSGVLRFKWKEVDGADRYELRIYRTPSRGVASDSIKAHVFKSEDAEIALNVPKDGQYTWEVRAIASEIPGPKSTSDFKVDPNAMFHSDLGYVALSTMLAPYNYKIVSRLTGVQGTFSAKLTTFRLSGEYWIKEQWGIAGGLEHSDMTVLGQNISRMGAEVTGRYRVNLSDTRFGYVLMPKFGFETREYPELRPVDTTRQAFFLNKPLVFGPVLGTDLRRQFDEEFSVGLRLNYFIPLALTGVDGKLSGGANMRNLNIGLQGLYWLTPNWGLGLGGFFDFRSMSYDASPSQMSFRATGVNQEIYMDGAYFFGSLIYNFGR
jgi:hypothetical protein